ncbi:hypothetical protein [Motilimonas eburnea]|uniref:hypothetical protein n=1 Tax=Motilimonas eburnea TaxID=1737488 RepID=UPI001E604AE6|nr:hypothetical protein [Motilimonas eburnea]MCE2571978.1 hypothetical protein [Motilimonas eburnea]
MCKVSSSFKFRPLWMRASLRTSVLSVLLTTLFTANGVNAKTNETDVDNPFVTTSTYLTNLPRETYTKLKSTFAKIYQQTTFDTDLAHSTFSHSSYYDTLALPLVSSKDKTVNLEVFGQLYDENSIAYSQMVDTLTLHEFHQNNSLINQDKDDIAVGFGLNFALEENVKLRTLYSTGHIPGHGTSQFSLGIEMKY